MRKGLKLPLLFPILAIAAAATDAQAPSPDHSHYVSPWKTPWDYVRWLVMKSPVEISAAQINAFAEVYPDDARPLQPLNGRVVEETE